MIHTSGFSSCVMFRVLLKIVISSMKGDENLFNIKIHPFGWTYFVQVVSTYNCLNKKKT